MNKPPLYFTARTQTHAHNAPPTHPPKNRGVVFRQNFCKCRCADIDLAVIDLPEKHPSKKLEDEVCVCAVCACACVWASTVAAFMAHSSLYVVGVGDCACGLAAATLYGCMITGVVWLSPSQMYLLAPRTAHVLYNKEPNFVFVWIVHDWQR